MKKLAFILPLLLTACTDDPATIRTLQSSGFSNITTTGYAAFECSDSDTFATGFIATNPAGKRVSGVVCCGLLKGCTVRF
jgi:hypothetical protein